MRSILLLTILVAGSVPTMTHAQPKGGKKSIYDFKVTTIDGKSIDLGQHRGKVLLIVNVASECGYTDQYKALQALHAKHAKDGLAILAFPCNDFGGQEPGDNEAVKKFARTKYGVEFDIFSKISILGKDAAPLYKFLTSKEANPGKAGEVKWNFEKFIIGRDGSILGRFAADVEPDAAELTDVLRKALQK
jgi:glutathione peroxidase